MTFNRLLIALVLGILLGVHSVFAQARQNPKADWAIYVGRQDGMNFQFLVYQKDDHIGGAALSHLPKRAGWETPPDKMPVADINLMAYWENGVVQVKVTVVYNDFEVNDDRPKYGSKEEPLTEFQLPQGKTVVVKELERVGLLPITLRLVPPEPKPQRLVPAAFPETVSKVPGIEVISLEKLPARSGNDFTTNYEATLTNATGKTIVYLEADRDAPLCHCMAAGEREGTLHFAPGANYKMRLWIAHPQPGGFGSSEAELKRPFTFSIVTAIFADGSYIGEPKRVARRVAYWRGVQLQNERLRPLLDRLLESAPGDLDKAVAEFLKESDSLRIDPPPAEVESIMARFPGLNPEDVKRNLLLALAGGKVFRNEIELNHQLTREDPKNYTREAFIAWLRRETEGRIYHRKL
jgi:hypothetical protein